MSYNYLKYVYNEYLKLYDAHMTYFSSYILCETHELCVLWGTMLSYKHIQFLLLECLQIRTSKCVTNR